MTEASGSKGRVRVPGRAVLALWVASVLMAYAGFGRYLNERFSGITPEQRSIGLVAVSVVVLLAALVATILWARGIGRAEAAEAGGKRLGRRRFLVGAATSVGGIVASGAAVLPVVQRWMGSTLRMIQEESEPTAPSPRGEWQGARVRSYRRLGRTGVQISDISLGSGRIRGEEGEAIARLAIERGVNYFDTSPDYSAEGSEIALGRAIKGKRDRMFIATKFCTPRGDLQAGTPVAEYIEAVEASLKRLQTGHVDLVHIHACDTLERLLDPNVHEAFDRLREQGKARFIGFSSHTPNLEEVANAAIESDRFDVMMLAYHHGVWPGLQSIVDRAAAKDIGVVAMKTLKGAKHHGLAGFREDADSYAQAAFKWVLSNPSVSGLVISFFKPQHVDEYLYASGKSLTQRDQAVLERYDRLIAGTHCHAHCGACLDACPEGLRIDDVLRHRMYFEDYGWEKEGMRLYARLPKQADVCLSCSAPCTGSCPHGIPIRERTTEAHRLLTLA